MPLTKQAIKKVRQDKRKTIYNLRVKKAYKQAVSAFRKSPTLKGIGDVFSKLDIAAKMRGQQPVADQAQNPRQRDRDSNHKSSRKYILLPFLEKTGAVFEKIQHELINYLTYSAYLT